MAQYVELSRGSFLVHNLCTQEECLESIEACEREGFSEAPVTTNQGPVMMSHIRDNERVMIDDAAWASRLYERLKPFIPEHLATIPYKDRAYRAVGLNERLRFYRYQPGQSFKMHRDGYFQRADSMERSFLTVLLYLNQSMTGGETLLYVGDTIDVTPETGQILCFRHELLHEAVPVETGRKYVLRTDVMYAPEPL